MESFFTKHQEGILYIVFGGFTVLVSWATYALFVWMGIDLNISNILSWVCGVSFAFVVNKWFVFRSHSVEKKAFAKEIVLFFLSRGATGIFAWVAFPILCSIGLDQPFFGTAGLIARIIVSVIEIVLNYVASKFIVFKKKEENA